MRVGFDVALHVLGRDADLIKGVPLFADAVLRQKPNGVTVDEVTDSGEHLGPQCGIERGVVDPADQCRELLSLVHCCSSSVPQGLTSEFPVAIARLLRSQDAGVDQKLCSVLYLAL